ncbi:MAG: peptidoglycan DD-metalloendopeptidase family protein [Defluviitaleaceae bacterium]|nr:peptidoglycan DD-metalloendopeptidase family protein [Defluviitaleaceae bacterium]
MSNRPNTKKVTQKNKGLNVALYSAIGGLLVLAVIIGYANLFNNEDMDTYPSNVSNIFDENEDAAMVSGTTDDPLANLPNIPSRQPQQPTPVPNQGGQPLNQPTPNGDGPTQPQAPPEAAVETPAEDPPQGQPQQQEAHHEDIYDIFGYDIGPHFTQFTENDDMHWPLLGEILLDFSMDRHIFDPTLDQWRVNDSISIAANSGDIVRAAADGIVRDTFESPQFGQVVVLYHGNGWSTTYRQLSPENMVSVGDVVNRGQIIGNVGSPSMFGAAKGYHISFNVQNDNTAINPHHILSASNN